MNKQLLTILIKRYGNYLLLGILFIFLYCGYQGYQAINRWQEQKKYYSSEEFEKNFNFEELKNIDEFKDLSLEEAKDKIMHDNLPAFTYTESNSVSGYSSVYLNIDITFPLLLICLIGFFVFFIDLKTSFNEFLFSLNVSKQKIYYYKHLLISLPLLLSILLGRFLSLAIFSLAIPSEYMNVSLATLITFFILQWISFIFYYACSSFIGLVSGHLLLGTLTTLGFYFSISLFSESLQNLFYWLTGREVDATNFLTSSFLSNEPISTKNYIILLLLSFLLLLIGSKLYSRLSLEKKGEYLLFDSMKLPTLLLISLYVPITLVFRRPIFYYSYSNYYEKPNILLSFIFYLIVTFAIGCYVIYRKQLHLRLQKKILIS